MKKLIFILLLPAALLPFPACESERLARPVFVPADSGESLLRKVPSGENLAVVLLNPQVMNRVEELRISGDSLFEGIEALFEPRTGQASESPTFGSSTNAVVAIIDPSIESVTTIASGTYKDFQLSKTAGENYRNIFISDSRLEQTRMFSSFIDKQTIVFGPAQARVKNVIDTGKDKSLSALGQLESTFGKVDIGFLMLIQSGETNHESPTLNLRGLTITAVSAKILDDRRSSVSYYLAFEVEPDAIAAENDLSTLQGLVGLTGMGRISNYELIRDQKILRVKFDVPHAEVTKL